MVAPYLADCILVEEGYKQVGEAGTLVVVGYKLVEEVDRLGVGAGRLAAEDCT